MNFLGNSIKRQRHPQMAKIIKFKGANSRIYRSSGGLFEGGGGLFTICSSRVRAGAYSRGGGLIRGFTVV